MMKNFKCSVSKNHYPNELLINDFLKNTFIKNTSSKNMFKRIITN